ncbi:ABC transporter substrate-binding protein [Paramicrobacterium chengjingii]|uniref:ABC transporter substrate-binding protein n=1 Tax=Paramicrobacterium chengjingii TaxID=2769067 RepID=UPI001F230460|nr:ABC transporter substrate-binding protein [Microbacterium chengjingii]
MTPEFPHSSSHLRPALTRRSLLGGGVALGLGVLLTACTSPESTIEALATGDPVSGGRLRVGLAGGGASDTLDAHVPVGTLDIARVVNLYEPLFYWDDVYKLQPRLATKAMPNESATLWTVTLRDGVLFHDGRPLTAADVVATFERITDPDDPKAGAAGLAELDHVEVIDNLTVAFHLSTPLATFDDSLAQYMNGIVPADYDPASPIGTGPFKVDSFTAGRRSVFMRNDDYWQGGEPYLDELEILNFNDEDALINALLSTQVDAVGQVPLSLLEVIGADPRIAVLNSETGTWLPFTMRVDKAPFDDKRVRQAFRLAVDRPQMVEQVLSGNGTVGNDLYAPFDPGYNTSLPQRKQDVTEAKRLLADAGYPDGIDVELVTAPIQAGVVEAAQVFAQQATAAGIRVKIRKVDVTTFFGDSYLEWPFAQDFWYTRNFISQSGQGSLPNSPFNETHWDDPEFQSLIEQAKETVDADKRNALVAEAQKIEYEKGGYIVWGFANQADAYQKYVAGLVENRTGLPLSGFEFRRVWMAVEK